MLGHAYGEKHQSWEFSLKELADKILATFVTILG